MELRYLEGAAALKERIGALSGRTPNALQVEFAAACLLHGRLFWDSARRAPLETQPLLLYYGAAAFAKALVVAYGKKQQDLSQSHGLVCAVGNRERIADFSMKAKGNGLFQQFNDVVAPLNKFCYFEDTMPRKLIYPTACSADLSAFKVTLDDCLSRLPDLAEVYELSTGAEAKSLSLSCMDEFDGKATHTIRVNLPRLYEDEPTLRAIVADVRAKAPFLALWRVKEAQKGWGKTVLLLDNYQSCDNEHYILASQNGGYITRLSDYRTFDALGSLPPLTGGSGGTTAYMHPINGNHVSEFSIMLAALLGLSSLVRYHPHTWTACIYRRQVSGRPVDDQFLPVIEEFLAMVQAKFPRFIAEAIL